MQREESWDRGQQARHAWPKRWTQPFVTLRRGMQRLESVGDGVEVLEGNSVCTSITTSVGGPPCDFSRPLQACTREREHGWGQLGGPQPQVPHVQRPQVPRLVTGGSATHRLPWILQGSATGGPTIFGSSRLRKPCLQRLIIDPALPRILVSESYPSLAGRLRCDGTSMTDELSAVPLIAALN